MGFSEHDLQKLAYLLEPLCRGTLDAATPCYDYVVTGQEPEVLREVQAVLQTVSLRLAQHNHFCTQLLLAPGGWDPAVTRRLGEVLALALSSEGYRWHSHLGTELEFFWALACATQEQLRFEPHLAAEWLLTAQRSLALLELAGADVSALVEILFTPYSAPNGRIRRWQQVHAMEGLPAALAVSPARSVLGAQKLRGAALGQLIEMLRNSGLTAQPAFRGFLLDTVSEGRGAEPALAALLHAPDGRALLEQYMAQGASPKVRRQIERALSLLPAPAHPPPAQAQEGSGYTALGSSVSGTWIAIPPALPLPADTPPPASFRETREAAIHELVEGLSRSNEHAALDDQLLHGAPAAEPVHWHVFELYRRRLRQLLSQPGVTLHHLARVVAVPSANSVWRPPHVKKELYALVTGTPDQVPLELLHRAALAAGDFRTVLDVCAHCGMGGILGAADVLRALLDLPHSPFPAGARPPLWQVIAEHLYLIDEALGLAPTQNRFVKARALELLLLLPATPDKYRDVLVELAIKGSGEERPMAQALLAAAPDIDTHLLSLLANDDQQRRRAAARWLQKRGLQGQERREAAAALRAALARERVQSVRIALLGALAALGEDICQELRTPGLLVEEPREDALPLEQLPAMTWADGQPVTPAQVRGWILYATKPTPPYARPLLRLALDHLEAHSAQQLGLWALDTCLAGQKRNVLALTRRIAPQAAVQRLMRVLLGPARSSSIKLLLSVLAEQPALPILQLLVEVSARRRKTRVRVPPLPGLGRAQPRPASRAPDQLLARLAAELGLSREELVDRAVPTLGLDERGELLLPASGGALTASVGPNLQVVLRNAQGETVPALRAPQEGSDKALKRLRQMLPLIVEEQSTRLQQAMQRSRIWRPEDLRTYLFAHPITGRLCQALIFAGMDALGDTSLTFRPLADGSCINAAGEPVSIAGCLSIRLAHLGLMDEPQLRAWQQHLEDYKLVPPFAQLR